MINLNPFAIVLAGFFVVVLIALYIARRGARRHAEAQHEQADGWGRGVGDVGEEPELVDVYAVVEKGGRERERAWGWEEVMVRASSWMRLRWLIVLVCSRCLRRWCLRERYRVQRGRWGTYGNETSPNE